MVTPAQTSRRFLAPGDQLGKHVVIRQIAVGGMAELYLTRTVGIEGFEKLVCVKRILPQYINNPSFVNMFLNEARLAATLHHPNIAQVYDIGQESGEYFFSMEYVHGEDLGRLVATGREDGVQISLDCVLTLVAGLCAGLHHAHDKAAPDGKPLGVVHRDVSPTNVLVSYDGAVKLVDFGIARAGEPSRASQTGGLKGKISYMSPEQCRGKATLDRRSDVFSVGTILYELTTGRLPFLDETEYGVLHQIVNRDADPPSTLVPNYPPALEAIVMRALARDPDRRLSTALELQHQLEDFAHDNRLRVSPLVLARLMSTLFPARLEEWDHARAQGAFFVEQHVVRTLIESGKTAEGVPHDQPPPGFHGSSGSAADAPTSADVDSIERTQIGPEPRLSPLVANARPGTPRPVANARPGTPRPEANARPGTPPVANARPATPPPVANARPGTPRPGTPRPVASAHASGVRSSPSRPAPVPNMPGAVPIVGSLPGPPIPIGGTLVSSATQAGTPPPPVMPLPSPYASLGSSGGFGGASGGTLVSSATQAGHPSAPMMPMPAPYLSPASPGSLGGFAGASGGTLVSSATQVGNPPPVMPLSVPYPSPGSSSGFAGPSGPGGVGGGAAVAHEPSSYPVGDVTDRVRVSAARPTLVIRSQTRSRRPFAALALVAAAGAVAAVWLTVGRSGDADSMGGDLPASVKTTPPANSESVEPAKALVPTPPAEPAAEPTTAKTAAESMPAVGSAVEPAKVAQPAAEPAVGSAVEPAKVAQPAAEPAVGSAAEPAKVAQPTAKPPNQPVPGEPSDGAKPEPARKATKAVVPDARTKAAKPKRTESKRGQKAEPKEQPWNDDSPFMPVPASKR